MPLVQQELNLYVYRFNTSGRRTNCKAVLPTAAPIEIYENPSKFGVTDLKACTMACVTETITHLCDALWLTRLLFLVT